MLSPAPVPASVSAGVELGTAQPQLVSQVLPCWSFEGFPVPCSATAHFSGGGEGLKIVSLDGALTSFPYLCTVREIKILRVRVRILSAAVR